MRLAARLGVSDAEIAHLPMLQSTSLPETGALLDEAFRVAPTDPQGGQILLASAILSEATRTTEGRHAAALSLLSPLVAKADPYMTLGPKGADLREDLMPNGWRYTINSWERLRYAWREGLWKLLGLDRREALTEEAPDAFGEAQGATEVGKPAETQVRETGAIVSALDEVTRLSPAEPEPVKVAIQEQWPNPRISFFVAAASLGLTGWTAWYKVKEIKKARRRR